MFKRFIEQMLKEKPAKELRNITLRAARTNLEAGNYFEAMKLFSQSKEYSEIYQCTCDFVHIYPFVIKQNKDVFSDIANPAASSPALFILSSDDNFSKDFSIEVFVVVRFL